MVSDGVWWPEDQRHEIGRNWLALLTRIDGGECV